MRVIVIASQTDHSDGSRDLIAEVNDTESVAQYSRTPFHFAPDVTNEEADAAIVAELAGYLTPDDPAVITR